jgi:hypothetical protein
MIPTFVEPVAPQAKVEVKDWRKTIAGNPGSPVLNLDLWVGNLERFSSPLWSQRRKQKSLLGGNILIRRGREIVSGFEI